MLGGYQIVELLSSQHFLKRNLGKPVFRKRREEYIPASHRYETLCRIAQSIFGEYYVLNLY